MKKKKIENGPCSRYLWRWNPFWCSNLNFVDCLTFYHKKMCYDVLTIYIWIPYKPRMYLFNPLFEGQLANVIYSMVIFHKIMPLSTVSIQKLFITRSLKNWTSCVSDHTKGYQNRYATSKDILPHWMSIRDTSIQENYPGQSTLRKNYNHA